MYWIAIMFTPLLKKKPSRPITNFVTISNTMERLALSRLKSHLTISPNFGLHQSACWSTHSTETTLIKIVDDILTSVDSGSVVRLVDLDISAAFDTVAHQPLFPVRWTVIGVWHRFVSTSVEKSRSFSVHLGQSRSSGTLPSNGVHQGSVLGWFLFTVYVSPIRRLIDSRGVKYHCYADDAQLCTALITPCLSGIAHLKDCSKDLQIWFWQNNLLLNQDKYEVIYLGTRQRLCNFSSTYV